MQLRAVGLIAAMLGVGVVAAACGSSPSASTTSTTNAGPPSHLSLTIADNNKTFKVAHTSTITVTLPYTVGSNYQWQRVTGGAGFLPVGQSVFRAGSASGSKGVQVQTFHMTRSVPLRLGFAYVSGDNLPAATKRFAVTLDPSS
jgi:hypothetical protein